MKEWRLKELSRYIDKTEVIADIGTDHAYLPIYISKNKLAKKVYASDNKVQPLDIAKKNVKLSKLSNIELLFGEGLEPYKNIKLDTIIISGIGGNTIINILKLLRNEKLILEPRNNVELLRVFLKIKNYRIINEIFISKNNKPHIFITATYDKKIKTNIVNEIDQFIGPLLKDNYNKDYVKYINNKYFNFKKLNNISNNDIFNLKLNIIDKWRKDKGIKNEK